MNEKTTKRALFSSVLAIVLCLAMLIGTTFAWFTDTASTGVNKIQAGNLDVKLEYATAWDNDGTPTTWANAEGQTLNFKTADNRTTEILWEPGCTYVLPELRIVNNGNLALKYKIQITGAKDATPDNGVDDLKLLDVIDWTYSVSGAGGDDVAELGTERHLNAKTGNDEVYDTLTIQGVMQTTAGNDYMNMAIEGIAITVTATQDTVENDSFDNKYDKNAVYPDADYVSIPATGTDAEKQAALNDAITNAANDKMTVIDLPALDTAYTLSGSNMGNKNITITGTKDTVIDIPTAIAPHDATIAMEGVTVTFPNADYTGLKHAKKVTYKDCTLTGRQTLYADEVVFDNCTFTNTEDYSVWTYGAKNVTFNKCEFVSGNNSKAVLCYVEGGGSTFTRTFNNCTFTASGTAGKSAIMINPTANDGQTNTYNVIVNSCTATGYAVNGISDQTLVGLKETVKDSISVTINGDTVYTH